MKRTTIIFLIIISSSLTFAQRNSTGIDIKVGAQLPLFNFDDLYNTGYGLSVTGLFQFYDDLQFTLGTGYNVWSFDNEEFNRRFTDNRYNSFDLEAPIKIIPLTIGIKYYTGKTKVKPYLSADGGFFYFSQQLSGTYTYEGQVVNAPNQTESGFKTMISLGAGFVTQLAEMLDLDFQVKFNSLINATSISNTGNQGGIGSGSSTIYYLSIMGGINYYF